MSQRIFNALGGACTAGAVMLVFLWPQVPATIVADSQYCKDQGALPQVVAKAAYMYDGVTGEVLYEKEPHMQLPLASLTKLMTVLTAVSLLPEKSTVRITPEALQVDGDSGLSLGEAWNLEDLAHFVLITSSNDGAHALALESARGSGAEIENFHNAMNNKAKALGLSETYYLNDTGLDMSPTVAGAYGSARDMAILALTASRERPELFEYSVEPERSFTSLSGRIHIAKNTSLAASTLLASSASKTGYTDLAGGNLAVVFEPVLGHPVAIAVLGSTREGRDRDVEALATYARTELRRDILCKGDL